MGNKKLIFVRGFVFFVFWIAVLYPLRSQTLYLPEDTVVFGRFLQYSERGDGGLVHTARFFMNTPYMGGTLEGDDEERLRVNLRELDCVTFVENALALHLMLQTDRQAFDNFCDILQKIRYRNGIIDGYISRLHYFTEWIEDNLKKGLLSLPDIPICRNFNPGLSFMSTNCNSYPALKANPELCSQMSEVEKRVNELSFCYIPKEQVRNAEAHIQDGDIIAITTNIRGLDVAHVGFAVTINGRICLLHASLGERKVVGHDILHDYLARNRNHSGIIVARSVK